MSGAARPETGLVQVRIERLAQRLGARDAMLGKSRQQHASRGFDPLDEGCQRRIGTLRLRDIGERQLEGVGCRQQVTRELRDRETPCILLLAPRLPAQVLPVRQCPQQLLLHLGKRFR